jgi:hypothetical protein
MILKLKVISWLLIAAACLRLLLARFMWHFPEILLQLLAPYFFLAIGVVLVRTERVGRLVVLLTWPSGGLSFVGGLATK